MHDAGRSQHRGSGVPPPDDGPDSGCDSALLFVRRRYAEPDERAGRWNRWILGTTITLCFLFILTYLPGHLLILCLFTVFASVVILNNQFYLFLAAKRGKLFAVAAVPFHLLYHLYNGISFAVGLCRHASRSMFSRRQEVDL